MSELHDSAPGGADCRGPNADGTKEMVLVPIVVHHHSHHHVEQEMIIDDHVPQEKEEIIIVRKINHQERIIQRRCR